MVNIAEDIAFLIYSIAGMGIFIGLMIGFIFFNPVRKIKFIRKLLKKNLGIIRLRISDKVYLPIIKDFSKDSLTIKNKIFIIENGLIYRETSSPTGEKTITEQKIEEKTFEEGIPIIYLDRSDLLPLQIVNQGSSGDMARNPEQIMATLNKEIAANEAEMLKSRKEKIEKSVILVGILVLITMAISLFALFNTNGIGERLSGVQNQIKAVYDIVKTGKIVIGG